MKTCFTAIISIYICMLASLAGDDIKHTGDKPNLVKGLQNMTITAVKPYDPPKNNKITHSPNGIYSVVKVKTKKAEPSKMSDYELYVDHGDGSARLISFTGVYDDCKITWVSEKLVFIRVWWARHWGADYIFDAEKGVMIYEEGCLSKEWKNRIKPNK